MINKCHTRTPSVAASVVRPNTKNKKDENARIERKEIFLKSRRNGVSCFNIYIVVFAFSVEHCRRRYNLGQRVGDKVTKLSKIGFSMECFTADFLRFFTEKRQNLAFGWTAGYFPSNPSVSGVFLKFPSFLRS